MKRYVPGTYRNHRALRIILTAAGITVFAVVLFLVCFFYSLKQYVVYTPDGIRLDVPWAEDD
jgi:hypothetical protein